MSSCFAQLDELGYCVVENALDDDVLSRLQERLAEQAAGERAAGVAHLEHDGANQRLMMLPAKGEVFRELLTHPLIDEVMPHLLDQGFVLSSLNANVAGRGGEEMLMHSDQSYLPFPTPRPVVANIMWMVSDFTEDNGATRLIPRTHLRPENVAYEGLPPDEEFQPVAATGKAGDALVLDGRIWHGTGRNVTSEPRYGILSYFCRPWIRQQENFFLALPDDLVAALTVELRSRLGWRIWSGLGRVGQGQHTGDHLVERVAEPIGPLHADGTAAAY